MSKIVTIKRFYIFASLFFLIGWKQSIASSQWPNEPSGATVITDWQFNSLSGNGWVDNGGNHGIVSDSSAPLSPGNVYQQNFYVGMQAGISPAGDSFLFPSPSREVYLGFWWKASVGFQQHGSNRTKILFLSDTGGNPLFFYMGGAVGSSRYSIGMQHQNSDICNGDIAGYPGICGTWDIGSGEMFNLGEWVKIELYVKQSTTTTSQDGILRYWVNGVLARSFTTWNSGQNPFNSVPIVPIWGGVGGIVSTPGTFSYDHIHVSIPNCSGSCGVTSGGGSVKPPSKPSNLKIL